MIVSPIVSRLQRASAFTSLFVVLLGIFVLAGWTFNNEVLKRIVPRFVAMNPVTALCFVCCGVSLWLLNKKQKGYANPAGKKNIAPLARALAACVGLIGLIKLASLLGWDAKIDQMLFREKLLPQGDELPNRMAPNTALNFVLTGLSLLLLDVRHKFNQRPAQLIALTSIFFSWLALLGYFFGARSLYGVASYIPMAFHTAVAFLVIGLGILCSRCDEGLMAVVTSNTFGGRLARVR